MIEAKIIEVQLSESSREGVNWDLIQARIGEFMIAMNQTFLNPTMLVVPSTKPTASVPYFRFFVGNKNLDINNTFIDLLRTQGKVKVVSNPKVATLNNQRAVIKVARQDVYFEEQQSQGSGGSQNLTTYTPKFITIGLILDVIPQIDSQGNVLMDIHPVLTEKVGVVRSPGGSEVPVLDMRETDTMVRLRDGETVIIGGLIKDYSKKDMTGTKYLESLPLVGKFFRLDQEESLRSELVVVLTPRIVWDREVR
jgi:type II secretory pathway component GspD/PulD (secretin)